MLQGPVTRYIESYSATFLLKDVQNHACSVRNWQRSQNSKWEVHCMTTASAEPSRCLCSVNHTRDAPVGHLELSPLIHRDILFTQLRTTPGRFKGFESTYSTILTLEPKKDEPPLTVRLDFWWCKHSSRGLPQHLRPACFEASGELSSPSLPSFISSHIIPPRTTRNNKLIQFVGDIRLSQPSFLQPDAHILLLQTTIHGRDSKSQQSSWLPIARIGTMGATL